MSNNKRIIKNTLFLYFRMIVIMGIGLYTVREILNILGEVDYGIYNVVGSIVAMFSFLKGTLTTSSQRYFSIEIANGTLESLNKLFSLNVVIYLLFIVIFIILSETLGLWLVNTMLTIPPERLYAANIVYQFSIISFSISLLSIPYNALIIAHERMDAFAYISIIEAVLKLLLVFILAYLPSDKLILYGLLMLIISTLITSSYILFSMIKFKESKFKFYFNKKKIKEILGFSGWHFLGTFAVIMRSQGINILINLFFNPVVNTARAISFQIYSSVSQLSDNFFNAVKPQIYKTYASNHKEEMHALILRSTIICSYLISILIFPILSNTSYVLSLWLKRVPEFTIIFTQLVLINGLIDSVNGPTICAALASGKIKKFMIIVSSITILNFPISYIALSLGAEPIATVIISISLSYVNIFVRSYLLKELIEFPQKKYIATILRINLASILSGIIIYIFAFNKINDFIGLIILLIILILLISIIYFTIVFSKNDKKIICTFLKMKITKITHR